MGQVCAKNDAGKVATDAPRPNMKRQDKELVSKQAQPAGETKFVKSKINFNLDKGVDKKADQVAQETAE